MQRGEVGCPSGDVSRPPRMQLLVGEAGPGSCCEHWLWVYSLCLGIMRAHHRSDYQRRGRCPGLLLAVTPPAYLPYSPPRLIFSGTHTGLPSLPCLVCSSHTAGTTPVYPFRNHFPSSAHLFINWHTVIHPFKPTSAVTDSVMPVLTPT